MKLTDRITLELMRWCPNNATDVVIPRILFGGYERDVLKLINNGLFVEYEIKIYRGDFYNDFKKGEGDKHQKLSRGESKCNRFFYVMPKDLISIDECPSYAGLIWFDGWSFQIAKNAPLLHKTKADFEDYKFLAHKAAWRLQIIQDKYRNEIKDKEVKKKVFDDSPYKKRFIRKNLKPFFYNKETA